MCTLKRLTHNLLATGKQWRCRHPLPPIARGQPREVGAVELATLPPSKGEVSQSSTTGATTVVSRPAAVAKSQRASGLAYPDLDAAADAAVGPSPSSSTSSQNVLISSTTARSSMFSRRSRHDLVSIGPEFPDLEDVDLEEPDDEFHA